MWMECGSDECDVCMPIDVVVKMMSSGVECVW